MRDSPRLGRFEHVVSPGDIRLDVGERVFHRRLHPGPRRNMHNGIEFCAGDDPAHLLRIANVPFDHFHLALEVPDVSPFDGRIVKVVEIVQRGHGMPGAEQFAHSMGADKSGATGHEYFHPRNLSGG